MQNIFVTNIFLTFLFQFFHRTFLIHYVDLLLSSLYDHPHHRKLHGIESRASRLTERASERAAIAKMVEETAVFFGALQFRYVGAICS